MEPTADPAQRLDAYGRETLRLAPEGAHRAAAALAGAPLPAECRARLVELHREHMAPFLAALHELGVPEPELTGQLLGGALRAAMAAIEGGRGAGHGDRADPGSGAFYRRSPLTAQLPDAVPPPAASTSESANVTGSSSWA